MWEKRINDWLKLASPIVAIVSLAGCIALTVVCIKMSSKLKATNAAISNYATEPHFKQGEKPISLLDILRQYESQINDLYNGQRQIRNYQSNLQSDLNRSNRFLNDYNSARFFEDDWPMKQHY